MGIIGKKNEEFKWKNSNKTSSGRRQSTNDIVSNLKEKHRRPSEEALFSSGKKTLLILNVVLETTVFKINLNLVVLC